MTRKEKCGTAGQGMTADPELVEIARQMAALPEADLLRLLAALQAREAIRRMECLGGVQ